LYIILLDKTISNPDNAPHGREGFYFGANGEHKLYDLCKAIARALVDVGKGKDGEPTTFTEEEFVQYIGVRNLRFRLEQ
jgi:hypothetical protein